MTYQRRYNIRRGIILADALLALAISALFVSGITAVSLEARNMYDRASARSELLNMYVEHAPDFVGMLPYEVRDRTYMMGTSTVGVEIKAQAKWYGNDRIETDITVRRYGKSIDFAAVNKYPYLPIENAVGESLCSPEISGGSSKIATEITPIILPTNPLLPLTDIQVRGNVAYITADSAVASDPDLIIADMSDPKNPRIISQINTGPGLRSLAIAGQYVYAAAASTAAQLHVIRLDGLATPVLMKKYQLPLPTPSTTPAMGSSIYYGNGTVYLGTEKWAGNEFEVINVLNPANPIALGGYDVDSKINSIVVRDKLAHVASASQGQIQTLDVSDSSHPKLTYFLSPSGWQRQEGQTVSWFEDSLNAGRTSGGYDVATDHELFTWPYGSTTPMTMNIPGGVYGVVANRDRLYIATRNVDHELTILDRSLASTSATYYSLPVAPQAMTCDADKLYILSHNAPAIYEIKVHSQ